MTTMGLPRRYPLNNLDAYHPLPCPRCGATPEFDWVAWTVLGDEVPMSYPLRHWCMTPGCVDENGLNTVPRRADQPCTCATTGNLRLSDLASINDRPTCHQHGGVA